MLEKLAGRIVEYQINKGTLQEEERNVYQYAYELLLNQLINIVIAIVIAAAFQNPAAVLIFLLSYIPLRTFAGGYHANTNLGCTIVSAFLLCFVCLIVNYARQDGFLIWYPVSFIISGGFIFRYAPVQDRNKPLDELEIIRYKSKSRIIWCIEIIMGILFYFFSRKTGMVIALSHLFSAFMLGVGAIKNKKFM